MKASHLIQTLVCAFAASQACQLDNSEEEFLSDLVDFLIRLPSNSAVLVIGTDFSDCFEYSMRTSPTPPRRLPDFEGLEQRLMKEVGFAVVAKGRLQSASALLLTRGVWSLPSEAEASLRLRLDSKVYFYTTLEEGTANIEEIYFIKGKPLKSKLTFRD